MKIRSCVSVVSVLACASVVCAQGAANNQHLRYTQERHWTFSTIGDVGNAPHSIPSGSPSVPPMQIGSVGYEYRIATTTVTWGQYLGFIEAYAPVMPANFRVGITGRLTLNPLGPIGPSPINYVGLSNGVPQYTIDPAFVNQPATASWRNYARFVNWLHNGAPGARDATSAAFDNGVYDTSTFDRVQNSQGTFVFTDQDSRSPGSRFWIPSLDELIKAGHYDPNRYGEGEGGYWDYPTSSDTAPIPGDPALGGETNAGRDGVDWPAGQFRPLDVGSYPDTQSPWGLLDTMGGGPEVTETWRNPNIHQSRYLAHMGSVYTPLTQGMLEQFGSVSPESHFVLRLAAAIPAPGGAAMWAALAFAARRRRSS